VETVVADGTASVAQACRSLEVNRTSFYAWQTSASTVFEEQDTELAPLVRVIFKKHRRRYGARRIVKDLQAMGHSCSPRKVAKVMKTLGLRAIQPKSFVPKTTDSAHRLGYSPNLLLDAEDPVDIDQTWVGDITYVPLQGGTFCYLAMLMDLFSRRIVGWRLSEDMTEALVLSALRSAIKARQPSAEMIHHTDRGGQYAGHDYRAVLRRAEARQSMSRAGNCYDNAFMESCFGTIKTELELTEYENIREARKDVAEYIRYYNFERRHSALNYLPPAQLEKIMHPPK
jgi:transposase InsO family protein